MKIHDGHPVPSDLPPLDTPAGRAEAERRSQGCRYCGGSGLCLVDATKDDARPSTVSATCVCVHGRWIRAWHSASRDGQFSRLPDLIRIIDGDDPAWCYKPDGEEPVNLRVPNRNDINAMFRRPS